MYNNLEQVNLSIRKEINGFTISDLLSSEEKFKQLFSNLKLHSPELILDESWHQVKLELQELCKISTIRITNQPRFLVSELDGSRIVSTSLTVHTMPVASFSGFVNDLKHLASENTYIFLYNLKNDKGFKTVRYVTYTTSNPLIEPNAFKTT